MMKKIYLIIILAMYSCSNSLENNSKSDVNTQSLDAQNVDSSNTEMNNKLDRNSFEWISIIDYSWDYNIVVTEVTPKRITIGPIDESTGDFTETFMEVKDDSLLQNIVKALGENYYEGPAKIGKACGENDYYIGLSMKKIDVESKNITFVNYYSDTLNQVIELINADLPDSLRIKYEKAKIDNCK